MSRSRRKTPITGMTCADSEKRDKRIANRSLRRLIKQHIEDEIMPIIREVSDVWTHDKDGKRRIDTKTEGRLMRK